MTQELRSLYEITGDIKDINTVLVQRDRLEKAEKDAERYRWLRDGCDEKGNAASHIAANCYGMEWNALIDTAMEASK